MLISRRLFLLFLLGLGGLVFRDRGDQDQDWEPYPDKVDMLAIIAHPDDEGYWGGLLAYYAACQNKKVVLICLTSGEWGNGLPHPVEPGEDPDCSYDDSDYPCFPGIPEDELVYPSYYREQEMMSAAKEYGLKYKPIMPRWKDMAGLQPWGEPEGGFEFWGGEGKVLRYLTSQIRRFKPDVVVGLAWNGGNGNPQHIAASRGVVSASEISGNLTAFPIQILQHGVWQPKKVYLHVAEDETYETVHFHDWTMPCGDDLQETAQTRSARANAQHVSQEMEEYCDPATNFVLKMTTVGPDRVNNSNLFENV